MKNGKKELNSTYKRAHTRTQWLTCKEKEEEEEEYELKRRSNTKVLLCFFFYSFNSVFFFQFFSLARSFVRSLARLHSLVLYLSLHSGFFILLRNLFAINVNELRTYENVIDLKTCLLTAHSLFASITLLFFVSISVRMSVRACMCVCVYRKIISQACINLMILLRTI